MTIAPLDAATLEALCRVLGDTEGGLTGSEIGALLRQCQIDDIAPGITKRDPILALNTLRSPSEQSEQRGMMHLMKRIFAVFRNPTAHELKARWAVDEREALDLLTMVSVVHRRLDSAVRIPRGSTR
jgi:hypothetical protein